MDFDIEQLKLDKSLIKSMFGSLEDRIKMIASWEKLSYFSKSEKQLRQNCLNRLSRLCPVTNWQTPFDHFYLPN
jgi:hypothetical protein